MRHILHGDYIAVIADSNLMIKNYCEYLLFVGGVYRNQLPSRTSNSQFPSLRGNNEQRFYSHWEQREIKSAEFSILLMNPTKTHECSSSACYLSVSLRDMFDNPVYILML